MKNMEYCKVNLIRKTDSKKHLVGEGDWLMLKNEEDLRNYLSRSLWDEEDIKKVLDKNENLEKLIKSFNYETFTNHLNAIKNGNYILINNCNGFNYQKEKDLMENYIVNKIKKEIV